MKLKEYINSGILEEFSLGLLNPQQSKRVFILSQKYPIIKSELDKIQETLFLLDQDSAEKPSGLVKRKLLDQLNGSDLPDEEPSLNAYFIAASITGFIITAGLALFFWVENANTQSLLSLQNKNIEVMSEELNEQALQLQISREILTDTTYDRLELKGLGDFASTSALIYQGTDKLFVSVSGLPKPASEMQYQLWGIVDGEPVSAGLISPEVAGIYLAELPNMQSATAFAISLEPIGGSESPTPEQIMVYGEA